MIPVKQLSIAVIGDEDMVNGLRLAGIRQYFVIQDNQASSGEVRSALTKLLGDPDIGIIVIREEYMEYVDDMVVQLRQRRQTTPIVLEIPSKFGTRYRDVATYYKAFIRGFIGFDIEI